MNLIGEAEQDWDLLLQVLCHVCPLSPYFANAFLQAKKVL